MVSCTSNIWSMVNSIHALGYCSGAEEKKPSKVRFTSQHPGRVDDTESESAAGKCRRRHHWPGRSVLSRTRDYRDVT